MACLKLIFERQINNRNGMIKPKTSISISIIKRFNTLSSHYANLTNNCRYFSIMTTLFIKLIRKGCRLVLWEKNKTKTAGIFLENRIKIMRHSLKPLICPNRKRIFKYSNSYELTIKSGLWSSHSSKSMLHVRKASIAVYVGLILLRKNNMKTIFPAQ